MRLNIEINGEIEEFELYNISYHNQRLFCLGIGNDKSRVVKFISTKGFDRLLLQSFRGAQFNFKLTHFSPYLCKKEQKDIFRESDLIDKERENFVTHDIGPSEYSGKYITCHLFDQYRDDIYFETLNYLPNKKFDIFKYQTDDLYYTQHMSANKTHLPIIINQFNNDHIFGKTNIIHAVQDNGVELFDTNSLFNIADADLGYPNMNSFYNIMWE